METLQVLSLMSKKRELAQEKEELKSKVKSIKKNLQLLKDNKDKSLLIKDEKRRKKALHNYEETKKMLQKNLSELEQSLKSVKSEEKCHSKKGKKSSKNLSEKFMNVTQAMKKTTKSSDQTDLYEELSKIGDKQKKALLISDEILKTEVLKCLDFEHSSVVEKLKKRKKDEREQVRLKDIASTTLGKSFFRS